MQLKFQTTVTAAALLALATSASAQLRYDGLLNNPLGTSTVGMNATGHLVVSNIGSSGLDGVRINLGGAQGGSFTPDLDLGANGRLSIKCDALQPGQQNPIPIGVDIVVDATGQSAFYFPDFSGMGQQDYTLRLSNQGVLVYQQGGHTGGTKMQHGGGNVNPQTAYMTVMPFGPWGGAFLGCFPNDGGVIVTPPNGVPIAADFVEFISNPNQFIGVEHMEIQVAGPPEFVILQEQMRYYDQWMNGLDEAHLDLTPNGKLKVSNLGSSGCDGVSIDLGGGTGEVNGEMEEIAGTGNDGGSFTFESVMGSGEVDSLNGHCGNGQWGFTPDFSQLGSQAYDLELWDQGQLVFQQNGMTGPAVSNGGFTLFYKKTTEHANGDVTTEWCIGKSTSSAHTVAGGPTIQANMFTVRSQAIVLNDHSLRQARLRAGNLSGDILLNGINLPNGCIGTSYCVSATNSAGPGALVCSSGSSSVAANDLTLSCSGLPANKFGIYFYGLNQIQTPFGNGWRCVGGQLHRLPAVISSASGDVSFLLDNTAPPTPSGQISAGQDWNFQFWYRDPAAGGQGFNLSDGHAITFLP